MDKKYKLNCFRGLNFLEEQESKTSTMVYGTLDMRKYLAIKLVNRLNNYEKLLEFVKNQALLNKSKKELENDIFNFTDYVYSLVAFRARNVLKKIGEL